MPEITYYCPIKDSECNVETKTTSDITCFIAIPFGDEWKDTRKTVANILRKYEVVSYVADEEIKAGQHILCKICEALRKSDFGVIEMTTVNPNVMIEFGMILGFKKPVFILYNKSFAKMSRTPIPSDIVGLSRIEYSNQEVLESNFEKGLSQYLQKINIKQKRIAGLMELAKKTARDGDFKTTDRLVKIILDLIQPEDRFRKDLVKFLSCIFDNSEKSPRYYIPYGIALARIHSTSGNMSKALFYVDAIIDKLARDAKTSLEDLNEIDTKLAIRLSASLKGDMSPLHSQEFYTHPTSIYPYLWHTLLRFENPQEFIDSIVKETISNLEDSLILSEFLPIAIWGFEYLYAGWLRAVARFCPREKKDIVAKARKADKIVYSAIKKHLLALSRKKRFSEE